ncbi:MAG TPA: hypothetical protein VII94_02120, partial [Candidatus Saccharimonadales bacterium]
MSQTYRYDEVPEKHLVKKSIKTLVIIPIVVIVVGLIGWLIISRTTTRPGIVTGPLRSSGLVVAATNSTQTISEPYFTMELPTSWHQSSLIDNGSEYSITWMDKNPSNDTRWLTVYIDKIPSNLTINNLLPIKVDGGGLTYGTMSDNCSGFVTYNRSQLSVEASYLGIN